MNDMSCEGSTIYSDEFFGGLFKENRVFLRNAPKLIRRRIKRRRATAKIRRKAAG